MRIALLAYPRSGSTLLRLLISYILKTRPRQAKGQVCSLQEIIDYDLNDDVRFHKFHYCHEMHNSHFIGGGINALIGLFRDPIENMMSMAVYNGLSLHKISEVNIAGQMKRFMQNIYHYHTFNGEKKLAVIYEDMINDLHNEAKRIANYFDVTLSEADLLKISELQSRCFALKTQRLSEQCLTRGQDTKFYFNSLDEDRKKSIIEVTKPAYEKLKQHSIFK